MHTLLSESIGLRIIPQRNKTQKACLFNNIIMEHLKSFCDPTSFMLYDVSSIIRNLCEDSDACASTNNIRKLLDMLSILIFHESHEIVINALYAYCSLIGHAKHLNSELMLLCGIPQFKSLQAVKIAQMYTKKQTQDERLVDHCIKRWELEYDLQIPTVVHSKIEQYFVLFTDQKIHKLHAPNLNLIERVIDKLDCNQEDIQKAALQTLTTVCAEMDTYPVTNQAIDCQILLKLRNSEYLFHSNKCIRKKSYHLIKLLMENTVHRNGLECMIDVGMDKVLIKLLHARGQIQNDNKDVYDLDEQQIIFEIFVNIINYGRREEIQMLIDDDIHIPFFGMLFTIINQKQIGRGYHSAVDRLIRKFDVATIELMMDDITETATYFVQNVDVSKEYGRRAIGVCSTIQLALDARGVDWRKCLPLLFSIP
eukprot:230367_1